MGLIEIVVLALIQGFTEFLPISSSGHLILPSQLLGWQDQGQAFDIAVHVGTLFAVLIYFRKDVVQILSAWFKSCAGKGHTAESKLGWYIILATIPAGLVAGLAKDFIETNTRGAAVIATTTIVFGLALWYADIKAKENKNIFDIKWKAALLIGIAQAVALIPGTSRSGITITAGLLLGLDKKSAARFSFLMSIPVIGGLGLVMIIKLILDNTAVDWYALILGTVLSFVSAYTCIFLFLKFIERMGMLPFVIYRLILGFALFALIGLGYISA
ncbi:undecaprenyl-diphosphate phosphatase [Pseudoalteromonas spongiae]|uniref:undecaprenyl-diphosphate phosphatase n=1 Tax=Pseudoalteromonas spongiae TaxID=298657 RepID=UPI000C2D3A8C|nr:undecaprenyl-diphosphate phosphatase [Pseudoalteromonas spongiae]